MSYIEFLEENKSSDIYLINLNDENQTIYAENLIEGETTDSNYIIENIIKEEKEKLKKYEFYFITHSDEDINDYTLTEKILFYLKKIDELKKEGNFTNNFADYLFTKFDDAEHKYEFVLFIDT